MTTRTRLLAGPALALLLLRGSIAAGQATVPPDAATLGPPSPAVPAVPAGPPAVLDLPQPSPTVPAPAPAGAPPLDPFSPGSVAPFAALLAPPFAQGDYHATWYPNVPVAGQPTSLGMLRQDLT